MFWEYPNQVRSWFQPIYGFVIAKVFIFIAGDRPLLIEQSIRLCNYFLLLLALYSFLKWVKLKEFHYKNTRPLYFFLGILALYPGYSWYLVTTSQEAFCIYFLAYFMYIWQRAECCSLSFTESAQEGQSKVPKNHFTSHIYGLLQKKKKHSLYLLSGLLAGMCFEARFQIASFLVPFVLSYIAQALYARNFAKIKFYFLFILGGLFLLGLQALGDRWAYGNWSFPPFNNFRANLLEDRASGFGVEPFYYYLSRNFLFVSFFVFILYRLRFYKNIQFLALAIASFSFFAVHSAIGA